MRIQTLALGAVLALVALPVTVGHGQTPDIHGTWTAELHGGRVFLQVRTAPPPEWNRSGDWNGGWNIGQTFPVDELSGLPANDAQLTAAAVRFELRREAGTLGFDGAFRDGRGAGLFTFVPRPQYVDEMKRLGYTDEVPLWRQYQLAVQDVGPRYIAALRSEGLTNLTLDEITRSKNHGVTLEYIRAMKAEGYRAEPMDALVRAKDHGVDPAYVIELAKWGYKALPLADVVRARDHGVTADYLGDMRAIVRDATLPQLIRMHDHGVTPGFVNHARARGYTTSDPEELVRLKDRGLRQ